MLGLFCFGLSRGSPWTYLVAAPVIAVCGAVVVARVSVFASLPSSWAWARWLGKVSYAAYLWNFPFTYWSRVHMASWGVPLQALFQVATTLVAAQLSWVLLERPVARWRRRLDVSRGVSSGATAFQFDGAAPTVGT